MPRSASRKPIAPEDRLTGIVGLDIGTTAAKSLVVGDDGTVGERHEREYGTAAGVDEIVAAAVELAGEGPVTLSSAMHSLVGLDARDRPVTPLMKWSDPPAGASPPAHLHARTGMPAQPWTPLARLMALRGEGVRAARWVGIKELVVHRLTGEWVTDHSIASGTGLMALGTLDWDPEALDLAGLAPAQLPRLVACAERLGDVVVGAGDGPLANLGLGAVRPGVAAVSIGTSGALRVVVAEPAIVDETAFCYALTPGRWVVGGRTSHGGNVLESLSRTLGRPIGELLDLAARDGGPGPGAQVRAALEGVCGRLARVLGSLRDGGHEIREVRATGGFARSELFKQALADALAMPVGFTSTHEGSAYGAALLGLGIENPDVEIEETVEPRP